MKLGKTLGTTLVMSALLVALSACQKEEGPVEKAGKAVDNAAENVGDKVEEAGERIQDAAKK
jgi:hypothetical protein